MSLILWQAYAWFGVVTPFLKKIPWQVWAGLAALIAVLYYGHVRENRGYARCQTAVEEAQRKEVARQDEVASQALNAARERERQANLRAQEAQKDVDVLNAEVAKLKEAGDKCLPASVTDRFRHRK